MRQFDGLTNEIKTVNNKNIIGADNMNTYKKGIIKLTGKKDIFFKWQYIGERKTSFNKSGDEVDTFNISILYDGSKHDFKFYNSIMETAITRKISKGHNLNDIRGLRPTGWAGYDECKNIISFNNKRIYYLVYSFVNCYANDLTTDTRSFKDFCDSFGYDEDSRNALRIFEQLRAEQDSDTGRKLSRVEHKILELWAQEGDGFDKQILDAINDKDTINNLKDF